MTNLCVIVRRIGAGTILSAPILTAGAGCITVGGGDKPIHIVMDVNVRVRNELEDFYSFRKETDGTTQPSTQPSDATPAVTPNS